MSEVSEASAPPRRLSRRRRWFIRFMVLFGVAATAGGVSAWLWFDRVILQSLPADLSQFRTYRPPTSCRVRSADGTLIDEFHVERRFWVPLEEIPDHVSAAFISAEDRRFWKHAGVDIWGILRAAAANFASEGPKQGGSTLTQQLVKNLLVGSERSYQRKLREAVLARRLERELGKRAILELYLNFVYLGGGNYGVDAAARDYFAVPVKELDAGQAALIAGLVPAPSRYSPRSSPERARERRAIVLRRMVQDGLLTEEQAEAYGQAPVLATDDAGGGPSTGLAYVSEVRRALRELLGEDRAVTAGITAYVPMDPRIQEVSERAVRSALEAHAQRQGIGRPRKRLEKGQIAEFVTGGPGLVRDESGGLLPPRGDDCFQAVLVQLTPELRLRAGPWTYALRPEDRARVRGTVTGTRAVELRPGVGDVHPVCLASPTTSTTATPAGVLRLDDRPWAEGAAVVAELSTGRVLAVVGGYASSLEGFVRATQARRQPGSAFKPIVYAAALEHGRTQTSLVLDGPLSLPGGGGRVWRPKNYDGKFRGQVTLREALAKSLNLPAVRLALEVGTSEILDMARRLGVRTRLRADPTVALGASEVTLMDLIRAYGTIARAGVLFRPSLIDRLEDVDGRIVSEPGVSLRRGWPPLPERNGPRALPAGVSAELADMLREVVRNGTARKAWDPARDRAGKTGTTNGCVDAWFVGFDADYLVGVWVGTDGPQSLGEAETGGKAALPAWIEIMAALDPPEGRRRPVPDEARIDVATTGDQRVLARGRTPIRIERDAPLPEIPRADLVLPDAPPSAPAPVAVSAPTTTVARSR